MRRARLKGWRSVQRCGEGGAIESDERIVVSRAVVPDTEAGARVLGERYWSAVRRASLGLARMCESPDGSVLRAVGAPLLRFASAEVSADADGVRCSYPISGGFLARHAGGALVLSQSHDHELRAALTGFVPRLGARTYDQFQRRIHVAISRRFFRSLIGT